MDTPLTTEQLARVGPGILKVLARQGITVPPGLTAQVSIKIVEGVFPSVNIVKIDAKLDRKLAMPAESLKLKHPMQARFLNSLVTYGHLHTIGEIVRRTDGELLRYRGFSKKTLKDLKEALLEQMALALGMTAPIGPLEKATRLQRKLCTRTGGMLPHSTFAGVPDEVMNYIADSGFDRAHLFLEQRSKESLISLLDRFLPKGDPTSRLVLWQRTHPTGASRYQVIHDMIRNHCGE